MMEELETAKIKKRYRDATKVAFEEKQVSTNTGPRSAA